MKIRKYFLILLLVSLYFVTTSSAQKTPKLTVSPLRVLHQGRVEMHGTGFTQKAIVSSHLRRPDGTEFSVLRMLTDDHGEFFHYIDASLLSPGPHEVWVVDNSSKATSNLVRFEVILEQP